MQIWKSSFKRSTKSSLSIPQILLQGIIEELLISDQLFCRKMPSEALHCHLNHTNRYGPLSAVRIKVKGETAGNSLRRRRDTYFDVIVDDKMCVFVYRYKIECGTYTGSNWCHEFQNPTKFEQWLVDCKDVIRKCLGC